MNLTYTFCLSIISFFYLFLNPAVSQEKHIYANIEDQYNSKWNNLIAELYINTHENSFLTAILYDSILITDGTLEITNIVPTNVKIFNKIDFQIHPNPFSNNIILNHSFKDFGVFNIYNLQGKKVRSFRINPGNQIHQFSLVGLRDGFYFCELISREGTGRSKILKKKGAIDSQVIFTEQKIKSGSLEKVFAWLQFSAKDALKTTFSFELGATLNLGNLVVKRKESVFADERDGNKYKFTNIGNQTWMAENLAWLPSVVGPNSASKENPVYYVYDFNDTIISAAKLTENYLTRGVLYNYSAALEACPNGWRLPSKNDWDSLATFIQQENNCPGILESAGRIEWPEVGEYLKSDSGWISYNGNNKYDFNGLPGGYVAWGDFYSPADGKYWSSSLGANSDYAWAPDIGPNNHSLEYWNTEKQFGHSVRCISDEKLADTLEVLHTTIGPDGGKIIMDNFVIVFPHGVFKENVTLSVKLVKGDPFGENKQKNMIQLEGLPVDYSLPIQVKIAKRSETDSAIFLLEDVFTRSLNTLSETVVPLETTNENDTLIAEIPVTDNTKSAHTENKTNAIRLIVTEYEKYKVESEHFIIHNLMYKGVDRNHHLDSLASYLENAYSLLSNTPYNFSYSKRSWPMDVYVKPLERGTYGKFQESMFGRNSSSLTFNGWTLYKEEDLKASAIHEFFHLIQSFYDTRSSILRSKSASTSYWFDEAVSVWSEQLMVKSSGFVSGARNGNEFMPLSGFYTPLEDAEGYGYGMSAFVKYLIENYGFEYIKKIYETIETGGIYPVNAIDIEIPEEIHSFYDDFIEKYVLNEIYKDVSIQTLISKKSKKIVLNNSGTKTISINEKYKNLSSKIYTFEIDKASLKTNNFIKIESQNPNVHFLMLKYKKNASTNEWEKIKAAGGKGSVELKNIKDVFENNFNVILIATLCDPDDKTYYSKMKNAQVPIAEHNVSISFGLAEIEQNILCQLEWIIAAELDVISGADRDTSERLNGSFFKINIPLTNNGNNSYSSTFESRPFGGSNFEKGQFSITVVDNFVNFAIHVSDTYAEKDNSSFRRSYKISAENIPHDPVSASFTDIDDFKKSGINLLEHLSNFEFSEIETELSTGKVYNKTLIKPFKHIGNSIYLRIYWDYK